MINTNGIRIARERDFAARLAEYGKGFEVYALKIGGEVVPRPWTPDQRSTGDQDEP
jgi:hypothetical protein